MHRSHYYKQNKIYRIALTTVSLGGIFTSTATGSLFALTLRSCPLSRVKGDSRPIPKSATRVYLF
jgi:hypothetical protein